LYDTYLRTSAIAEFDKLTLISVTEPDGSNESVFHGFILYNIAFELQMHFKKEEFLNVDLTRLRRGSEKDNSH